MIGAIASLAGGLIGSLSSLFGGKRQAKKNMNDINTLGVYKENPYASQQLALGQNLYNARMGGAVAQEQNIMAGQANSQAAINRNATDASQALALAAGLQGQTNESFSDLATKEAADRLNRAGLLMQGQNTMIAEGDKVWGDKLRHLQQKIGVRSVQAQNQHNAMQGIGSTLSMFGNMWDEGQFQKKQ
jgi:hypothetical protein